ncbi:CAP domain-containing protein [Pedobacter endophyticus]|uniref:CAP domain-containing protein n=1 Tax=Pedobacter endophyticus TaxID=2789740 RepID=A0A7S9KYN4_9SPHI|nr:CAP domain-containing protein [Pedobacter endophyticus]QPH39287.1 CAP domain-containing protein [Pedobacter endophyticus]
MKKKIVPTMCIAALCLFASCSKRNDCCEIKPETKEEIEYKVNSNIDNDLLLKMVNDIRTAGCNCGSSIMPPVPAITWNHLLTAAAINQVSYMAAAKTLTHTSANGGSVGDRVTATGYKWRAVGENIAVGQKSEQEVFNAWLKSEGHCKNIMNAAFKEMGAAKVDSYWSQVFGTAL